MIPADPLIVPLGPLIGQEAGTRRLYASTSDAHEWLDPLVVRSQLDWAVELTRVEQGILASIRTLVVTIEKPCDRCLTPYEHACTVQGANVLFPLATNATIETDEEIETRGLDLAHQTLDLRPVLRDFLLLAAEAARVCRSDCPGLCATCGAPRGNCTCPPAPDDGPNTPLAGLQQLWTPKDT